MVSSGVGFEGGLYSSTMRLKEGWWNRACFGDGGGERKYVQEKVEERGLGEGRGWKKEYRSSGVSERVRKVGGKRRRLKAIQNHTNVKITWVTII